MKKNCLVYYVGNFEKALSSSVVFLTLTEKSKRENKGQIAYILTLVHGIFRLEAFESYWKLSAFQKYFIFLGTPTPSY